MAQRQFRSDDTSMWIDKYGLGGAGDYSTSGNLADSSRSGFSNTSFAGTSGELTGTAGAVGNFVAGDLVLIHQSRNGGDGVGLWELNKISSTGAGTNWTLAYPLMNTYATTGQVYRLIQYKSVTIGHTLTAAAWAGTSGGIVALLANTSISVTGAINSIGANGNSTPVTGGAYRGGSRVTAAAQGNRGEGTAGASSAAQTANGNGAGGGTGGAGGGGGGGAGGHATNGTNGVNGTGSTGGAAGGTAGAANLTTMVFGGAGGGGGNNNADNSRGGTGGNGGGIVVLIAPTITISGSISVKGGDGAVAYDTNGGGGGSGAAGSVLLKGVNLTLGSNLITATANTTAGAGNSAGGAGGQPSSVGRIHADYASSLSGTVVTPALDIAQDVFLYEGGGLNTNSKYW